MSGRLVYMNREFVPEEDARISIYDSALMFGDMVFEMTRSFNKTQFKLREHLERLYAGIKILRIPIRLTIDEMEQACYETIEKNDPVFEVHDEHRLMINVSRGPLGIYAPVFDNKIEAFEAYQKVKRENFFWWICCSPVSLANSRYDIAT